MLSEAEVRRLANVNLSRLYDQDPTNPVVSKVYKARMDAYRIPAWTESSGKEGWYE
jgi:hypothetical protein